MSRPAAPVAWPVTLLLPRLADGGGAADDGAGLADTAPDRGDGLLAEAEPLAAGPAGDGAEAVPLPATGWQAARRGRASDGPGHVEPRDGRPRCLSAPLRAEAAPDRGDEPPAEAEPLAAGSAGDGAEAVPLPATGWQAARQGRASDGPGHVAPRDGRPRCLSAPLRADTAPDRGAEPLAEQGAGGPKVRKPRGAVTGAPLIRRFFPRLVEFWPKSGD